MKTAMQNLINDIESFKYPLFVEDVLMMINVRMVEEKQQIIKAGNSCGNMLIANDIVVTGDHSLSVGENYYNQTFKP